MLGFSVSTSGFGVQGLELRPGRGVLGLGLWSCHCWGLRLSKLLGFGLQGGRVPGFRAGRKLGRRDGLCPIALHCSCSILT